MIDNPSAGKKNNINPHLTTCSLRIGQFIWLMYLLLCCIISFVLQSPKVSLRSGLYCATHFPKSIPQANGKPVPWSAQHTLWLVQGGTLQPEDSGCGAHDSPKQEKQRETEARNERFCPKAPKVVCRRDSAPAQCCHRGWILPLSKAPNEPAKMIYLHLLFKWKIFARQWSFKKTSLASLPLKMFWMHRIIESWNDLGWKGP